MNMKMNLYYMSSRLFTALRLLKIFHKTTKNPQPSSGSGPQNHQSPVPPTPNPQIKEKLLPILCTVLEQNHQSGMLYGVEKDSMFAEIYGAEVLHVRFEMEDILGENMVKCFVSKKTKTRALGLEGLEINEKVKNEVKKASLEEYPDWVSEDVATNKAVREHGEGVVEYNSEQKESLVARGFKNSSQGGILDSFVYKFDDLIQPMTEILVGTTNNNQLVAIKSDDLMRFGSAQLDNSSCESKIDKKSENLGYFKEIHERLVEHQTQVISQPDNAQNFMTMKTQFRVQESIVLSEIPTGRNHEKTKEDMEEEILRKGTLQVDSPHYIPVLQKKPHINILEPQIKVIQMPVTKPSMMKSSKKTILDNDVVKKQKSSKRMPDFSDLVNWVKSIKDAESSKNIKSQASNAFDSAKQQSGFHIPNVATFKTINRILSLFTVNIDYP